MMEPSIAVLDFEAASLHGFPIEVGVAVWDRGANRIQVWSSLIRPIGEWLDDPNRWDPDAEELHGISPGQLQAGLAPSEVMRALDAMVGGRETFCDGDGYDRAFLDQLAEAAGASPTFALSGLRALAAHVGLDLVQRSRFDDLLSEAEGTVEHRAGPDALRLLQALVKAIGLEPSVVHVPSALASLTAAPAATVGRDSPNL